MRTSPRARTALAGACTIAVLGLSCPAPAEAAPYTDDALLTISITTPLLGGTLTIKLLNFESGELIEIYLTGFDGPLGTVQADENGAATVPVTLPAGLLGAQSLTATGQDSGKAARSALTIRPLLRDAVSKHANEAAVRSETPVRSETAQSENAARSETPTTDASTGWGNVNYAATTSSHKDEASAAAVAAVLGLATLGGIGFAHRRRQSS